MQDFQKMLKTFMCTKHARSAVGVLQSLQQKKYRNLLSVQKVQLEKIGELQHLQLQLQQQQQHFGLGQIIIVPLSTPGWFGSPGVLRS